MGNSEGLFNSGESENLYNHYGKQGVIHQEAGNRSTSRFSCTARSRADTQRTLHPTTETLAHPRSPLLDS